ncbi:hypothetical protein [Metapseudomonas otitidis]|uniref:hypothetical protein n=1 Tax=Metapseudomonas otitidis TaxID=319939 RepID=UPI0013F5DFE7|nr:hypothetical protein [Pseudomonas otitidis]
MKPFFALLLFFTSVQAFGFSESAKDQIKFLERPFAITHISSLDLDCVWTKDDKGHLVSEAIGPYASGVCWHEDNVDEARRLESQGKLTWYKAPVFDHEYGDKKKCYYEVDKENGIARLLLGDDVTDSEAEECRNSESEAKAIALASLIDKKVEIGGYVARKTDLLGSLALACYTGSLDTNDLQVSGKERMRRYRAILDLYEGDKSSARRVTRAFEFASKNLSNRYPLDTRGQYRVSVCDQMVANRKF